MKSKIQNSKSKINSNVKFQIPKQKFCYLFVIWILLFVIFLTGCGPQWKRKFIRKRAAKEPEQVFVYEPQDYKREPTGELYKRHFIFWKAWQEELITKLGENKQSDLRSFEELFKNLDEMKEYLAEPKASVLQEYKTKIETLYNKYKEKDFDVIRSRQMREDLNRLMLRMDKEFRYSRVKDFMKQDYSDLK